MSSLLSLDDSGPANGQGGALRNQRWLLYAGHWEELSCCERGQRDEGEWGLGLVTVPEDDCPFHYERRDSKTLRDLKILARELSTSPAETGHGCLSLVYAAQESSGGKSWLKKMILRVRGSPTVASLPLIGHMT